MKEVCDRWGLTKGCFFSEPYTDVKNIREKTHIICMNFGNGGYIAHSTSEYCIIEDMDSACGMGIELIDKIGCTQHICASTKCYETSADATYKRNDDGTFVQVKGSDIDLLRSLGYDYRKSSYGYGSYSSSTTKKDTKTSVTKEDELKFETVKYIVDRYDSHILNIKAELLEGIKALCENNSIGFDEFEKVINEKFDNDIKF
jgi:hypothetical protein